MLSLPETENIARRLELSEELQGVVTAQPRTAAQRLRLSIYIATGTVGAIALVLCFLTAFEVMPWKARWATDWFLVALILGIGPLAYFKRLDHKRVEAIDEKFPDFLRDMAESARAGMTLPRALVTASRGQYGALTPEIRKMSAQVQWGVGFTDVLDRFSRRSGSPLIRRIVTLIIEARRAGGNVVDVLTAAADDAREIKQIVQSRNNQMKSYSIVIYVTFAVFLGVVLVIQAQFLPAFKSAVLALQGAPAVNGLRLQDFDPDSYNTAFFHASLMQAITGGLVGGVLTRGKALAGLGGIVFMVVAAWFSFRVLSGV
ncbi:MAG: archaeal flagellar protein FlaJ [Thermoplasmata archaeon]|jgi:flagellar protein FlaJ|nr:archaeal flagellar protein FlaJ [Thermoplasmata archaeon]